MAAGETGDKSVLGAFGDALKERVGSQMRSMRGHWQKNGGNGAFDAIQSAERILNSISLDQVSRAALSNIDGLKQLGRSARTVDLNEDLR